MFRRIESDDRLVEQNALQALAAREGEPVSRRQLDDDGDAELLPRGHPSWIKDGVSISQRARDLVARLQPAVVRVVRFWDHRFRFSVIAGRRVHVDAAGSYHVE